MFKKLSSSFLIVSACIFSSCTPTVKQEIAILPTPVSLTEQSGSFVLKDGMKIGVSDQSLFPAAGYLQEILRNVISSSVEVTTDKSQVQGRRIKNYFPVKVVTNIFHPIPLLVFSDSCFLLLFSHSLVW